MNKLCCWLTGGHHFLASDMSAHNDDFLQRMVFRHKCYKCGTVLEKAVPYEYLFRVLKMRADDETD